MASLKDISMSELAKNAGGLGLVKSGVSKNKEKGEWQDPYVLDTPTLSEITGEEIGKWPSGTIYAQFSVSIVQEDGTLQKAGNVRVDLPVLPPEGENDMTAEDEAEYLQKSGEKFLKFLRAIDQERFSVFKDIDKSDPKKWVYIGFDGKPMSDKAREKRAAEIDSAVVAVAEGLVDGSVSVVGSMVTITKRANPNNPKRPYTNFSAAGG